MAAAVAEAAALLVASEEPQANGDLGGVERLAGECLSIDIARKLTSKDMLERLAWLMATRGVPDHIWSDNGPGFTARVVREWLAKVGEKTVLIEPGSPWENGYVESFNAKLRDELLNRESFKTLLEARVLIERWRQHYDTGRPHSALGYRAPAPETIAAGGPAAGRGSPGTLKHSGPNEGGRSPRVIGLYLGDIPGNVRLECRICRKQLVDRALRLRRAPANGQIGQHQALGDHQIGSTRNPAFFLLLMG